MTTKPATGALHVIGGGMAGLASAVALARAGHGPRVVLHESAGQAGGRCRTYHDATLDREIDNGNHLLMAANPAALAYLETIGARDTLAGPEDAAFPFVDLDTGERWVLRPNAGRLPWWLFDRDRRVPGTRPWDYPAGFRIMLAGEDKTVADYLNPDTVLYRRLWEPLTLAVMNAPPEEASAALLGRVMRETFGKGGGACRPFIARDGLGHSLVEPALRYLAAKGVEVRTRARLRGLEVVDNRVVGLRFANGEVGFDPAVDRVILAVPHEVASDLLPALEGPRGARGILNAHFRLPRSVPPALDRQVIGVVGGLAQWLFLRADVVSVTVSAAGHTRDLRPEALLEHLWRDVAGALALQGMAVGRDATMPPGRLVHEKRATFLQTPEMVARRPRPDAGPANLVLSGDWTDTGLPATIEGAIRSGETAATAVMRGLCAASHVASQQRSTTASLLGQARGP